MVAFSFHKYGLSEADKLAAKSLKLTNKQVKHIVLTRACEGVNEVAEVEEQLKALANASCGVKMTKAEVSSNLWQGVCAAHLSAPAGSAGDKVEERFCGDLNNHMVAAAVRMARKKVKAAWLEPLADLMAAAISRGSAKRNSDQERWMREMVGDKNMAEVLAMLPPAARAEFLSGLGEGAETYGFMGPMDMASITDALEIAQTVRPEGGLSAADQAELREAMKMVEKLQKTPRLDEAMKASDKNLGEARKQLKARGAMR
jgi:hypothetical protein